MQNKGSSLVASVKESELAAYLGRYASISEAASKAAEISNVITDFERQHLDETGPIPVVEISAADPLVYSEESQTTAASSTHDELPPVAEMQVVDEVLRPWERLAFGFLAAAITVPLLAWPMGHPKTGCVIGVGLFAFAFAIYLACWLASEITHKIRLVIGQKRSSRAICEVMQTVTSEI